MTTFMPVSCECVTRSQKPCERRVHHIREQTTTTPATAATLWYVHANGTKRVGSASAMASLNTRGTSSCSASDSGDVKYTAKKPRIPSECWNCSSKTCRSDCNSCCDAVGRWRRGRICAVCPSCFIKSRWDAWEIKEEVVGCRRRLRDTVGGMLQSRFLTSSMVGNAFRRVKDLGDGVA